MAAPWALATFSCLITFFRNLTSHIPSLKLSCNNWIPSPTTASASHGGASPRRQQVVDDSVSVEVDVSLPITDGATHTSNACGTRSPTNAGSSRVATLNSSQPSPVQSIAVLFRRQELGKAVLGFAVPMTTGLFFNRYQGLTDLQAGGIVIALSVGVAITWNGMLLHGIWPRVASALEHFGALTILVAFFGLVSSFLPPCLVWACWLCCGLSCLPSLFLLCLVLPAAVKEESSAEHTSQNLTAPSPTRPDTQILGSGGVDLLDSPTSK